jgi:hypothetical protein
MFQALMQAQSQPSTTRTGSDHLPDPDAATAMSATTALNPHRQSRSKSPEKAAATAALTGQILQAIDDVKHYNLSIDQTQQPHKLKREITANFFKAITPNQRLINRILEQMQQAIEQHHHQMQIAPGHNSTYREKITLADVQQSRRAGAIDSPA